MHQPSIHFHPVVERTAFLYLHRDIHEVLLIARLRYFRYNLALVDVLLQRQQYLHRVHRLDQVVGNLRTNGLVHNVLFFALRAHHHWRCRSNLLDALQRLESCQAWHHLVEHHQVERLLLALLDGVGAVRHCHHFVAFLLKEQDVSLQQLNLVVNPKNLSVCHKFQSFQMQI